MSMYKLVGLFLVAVLKTQSTFACTSLAYRFMSQIPEVKALMESQQFTERLVGVRVQQIKSITYTGGLYVVKATNGCVFTAKPIWIPPATPGLCPTFIGVEVADGVCILKQHTRWNSGSALKGTFKPSTLLKG